MAFRNEIYLEEYVYDFSADGGAQAEIVLSAKANHRALPLGSLVMDMVMHVETAFTSGGSSTLDIGDGDDPNGYAEAIAVASLTGDSTHRAGQQAGVLIWDDTNDHYLSKYVTTAADGAISVTIATATMTAGVAHIYFQLIRGVNS